MQMNTIKEHKNDNILENLVLKEVTQFLTFQLDEDIYGIDILNIKEIVEYGCVTKVPMMPDFIAGVINLRGSVVPVVDLAIRFSQAPSMRTSRSSILILELEYENQKMEIGITVDVVNEVIDILDRDIELAPSFGTKIRTDFIAGLGKRNKKLLVLLNIEKILCVAELSEVVHH